MKPEKLKEQVCEENRELVRRDDMIYTWGMYVKSIERRQEHDHKDVVTRKVVTEK